jgi:hypothetical protein
MGAESAPSQREESSAKEKDLPQGCEGGEVKGKFGKWLQKVTNFYRATTTLPKPTMLTEDEAKGGYMIPESMDADQFLIDAAYLEWKHQNRKDQ